MYNYFIFVSFFVSVLARNYYMSCFKVFDHKEHKKQELALTLFTLILQYL